MVDLEIKIFEGYNLGEMLYIVKILQNRCKKWKNQGDAEKIESLHIVNMLSWSSPLCHWYAYCLGKIAASVVNMEFWSV